MAGMTSTTADPIDPQVMADARDDIVCRLAYERKLLATDMAARPECDVPSVRAAIAALDEVVASLKAIQS
jgi:hypothetical protein